MAKNYNQILYDIRIMRVLINLTYLSRMAYKHACIIFNDSDEIVATGYNYQPNYFNWNQSIHAEVDAINKIKHNKYHQKRSHNYKLLVVRLSTVHRYETHVIVKFGNSKPCENCHNAIKLMGIKNKNIIHSTVLN